MRNRACSCTEFIIHRTGWSATSAARQQQSLEIVSAMFYTSSRSNDDSLIWGDRRGADSQLQFANIGSQRRTGRQNGMAGVLPTTAQCCLHRPCRESRNRESHHVFDSAVLFTRDRFGVGQLDVLGTSLSLSERLQNPSPRSYSTLAETQNDGHQDMRDQQPPPSGCAISSEDMTCRDTGS